MKQKITIQLKMDCDKCKNKALRIAAEEKGVSSVSIEGDNKDKLVVIGVYVDTVCLGKLLKKKFRCVTILTVEEVKPPKPKENEEEKKKKKKEEEEKKKKEEEEKRKKEEEEKKKKEEKPACICIVPYHPCLKCHSPKCHGQCNPCSKKEKEKEVKKEEEKEKKKKIPVCLSIVPYDPCSKCRSPKCHGHCNPCFKCQSFKCHGQCEPRPPHQCSGQCPPWFPCNRCNIQCPPRYLPYPTPYEPCCRVVYDSYSDTCTII